MATRTLHFATCTYTPSSSTPPKFHIPPCICYNTPSFRISQTLITPTKGRRDRRHADKHRRAPEIRDVKQGEKKDVNERSDARRWRTLAGNRAPARERALGRSGTSKENEAPARNRRQGEKGRLWEKETATNERTPGEGRDTTERRCAPIYSSWFYVLHDALQIINPRHRAGIKRYSILNWVVSPRGGEVCPTGGFWILKRRTD